ncbi:hypothetical protein CYMTET_54222 [Cymbomonas tetramitiformis]|uniref:Uncharacterized protein n=1 Tax=Cymbomonas tetramitiformis TaxID=36881 RepID=A0AAE0EPA1_9CHLO|nr:hypothetical protein CYMTET_54222 [Cymbomonas tetramitiformis]
MEAPCDSFDTLDHLLRSSLSASDENLKSRLSTQDSNFTQNILFSRTFDLPSLATQNAYTPYQPPRRHSASEAIQRKAKHNDEPPRRTLSTALHDKTEIPTLTYTAVEDFHQALAMRENGREHRSEGTSLLQAKDDVGCIELKDARTPCRPSVIRAVGTTVSKSFAQGTASIMELSPITRKNARKSGSEGTPLLEDDAGESEVELPNIRPSSIPAVGKAWSKTLAQGTASTAELVPLVKKAI